MRKLGLPILAIVTLAAVVAAVLAVQQRRAATAGVSADGGPVLEGFADDVNAAAAVTIAHGEDSFTLRKDGEVWRNDGLGGYPARFDKIRSLLTAMTALRRFEAKTARPELFGKLNLDEPGPDRQSKQLTVASADGETIATLLVGKTRAVGADLDGTYVRVPDGARAWLAEGRLEVETDPADWSERQIIDLKRKDVTEVTLNQPNGEWLSLTHADAEVEDFAIADMPEGAEVADQNKVNRIGGFMEELRLVDVKPAEAVDLSNAVEATFRTFDGIRFAIKATPKGDTDYSWATFDVAPVEGAELAEEAKARLADWQDRLGGWAFKVDGWKSERLENTMTDVVKFAEAPAESSTDAPQSTPVPDAPKSE
jgi:hypothetical protein